MFLRINKLFHFTFAIKIIFTLNNVLAVNSFPLVNKTQTVDYAPDELDPVVMKSYRDYTDASNTIYNKVFDYYAEICAGSIWQKRFEGTGGTYGHSFMMLRGACIKKAKGGKPVFPHQLEFCEGGVVGVSTDYVFTNIQWLGSEGRDFMLYGNHPADVPFTRKAWSKIQKQAQYRGILDHVEYTSQAEDGYKSVSRELGKSGQKFREAWKHDEAIGTDFAVGTARGGLSCTRVPLVGNNPENRSQVVKDVILYLNDLNQVAGQKGYDYDGAVNNCSTTVHNSLASIGFWNNITNTEGHPSNIFDILGRMNDIVSPFNEMALTFKEGNNLNTHNLIESLKSNTKRFQYFKKTGWLPQQFGTLIEIIHPLHYKNEVFNTSNRTHYVSLAHEIWDKASQIAPPGFDLIFPQPLGEGKEFRQNTVPGSISMDLQANVEYWKERYKMVLEDLEYENPSDEVVQFLKQYFEQKYEQTYILNLHLITKKVAKDKVNSLALPPMNKW